MDIRDRTYKNCREQNKGTIQVEFEYYLQKLSYTIKHFLQQTPYRNDKVMLNNLYLSCLMTFLNQVTLSNYNKKRYKNRLKRSYNIEGFLNRVYISEQQYSAVLYHLPDNMQNYVLTLVNQIKKLIVKDMKDLVGSFEPSDSVIEAIIASSMGDSNNDQE